MPLHEQSPERTAFLAKRVPELAAQGFGPTVIAARLNCSTRLVWQRLRGNSERWTERDALPSVQPVDQPRRQYVYSQAMLDALAKARAWHREIPSLHADSMRT